MSAPLKVTFEGKDGKKSLGFVSSEGGKLKFSPGNTKDENANFLVYTTYQASEQVMSIKAANDKFWKVDNSTKEICATATNQNDATQFYCNLYDEGLFNLCATTNGRFVIAGSNCLKVDPDLQSLSDFLDQSEGPYTPKRITFKMEKVDKTDDEKAIPAEKIEVNLKTKATDSFTVCFCGTGCTRDEGEVDRVKQYPKRKLKKLETWNEVVISGASPKNIYDEQTGYIPVRIHKEISGTLDNTKSSGSVRGVGVNDWKTGEEGDKEPYCEKLDFSKLPAARTNGLGLVEAAESYNVVDDQYSVYLQGNQLVGGAAIALALHGANLAVGSKKESFNFIGHSRGAVEAIMAAWMIYFYGTKKQKTFPIRIFAIDPVPGPGEWWSLFTQLPPNVVHYVGIYAWDHSNVQMNGSDQFFAPVVPRPNKTMYGLEETGVEQYSAWWPNRYKYVADNSNEADPLELMELPQETQPSNYELYVCRGRHGTVAGNYTIDGAYKWHRDKERTQAQPPADNPINKHDLLTSKDVSPVPRLVYRMAREYLAEWGTTFTQPSRVTDSIETLRTNMHSFNSHVIFDKMGGGACRTAKRMLRPSVRRISSISGRNPTNSYYMEDVVGDPPFKLFYPTTMERTKTGRVRWKFL